MAKQKISFACNQCGQQTAKWLGCCPECKEWNTIEQQFAPTSNSFSGGFKTQTQLTDLTTIDLMPQNRLKTGIKEWDNVMGGGIMPGAFMMLTGDPGIGKSTLLLHVAYKLSESYKVLYFSSEESLEQVKQRAQRLRAISKNILFSDNAHLDEIIAVSQTEKPHVIIIDSIQNCYTTEQHLMPGSIGQLKESAFKLMRLAKEHTITVIASGHITKDGLMAGPKTLEHMVDAVFYLQGEDRFQTRILRSVKNRFGTVNELGFFEMHEEGLVELSNINAHLLEEISHNPGSALTSFIEGSRPLLLEVQALTINTKYPTAQRIISGIEYNQVILIAAILEKHLKINFSAQDIFFKISGGFKIKGSASDLAIALALLSSYFQKPLPEKTLALGELSLTGYIKPINGVPIYIKEAQKFGINKFLLAHHQKIELEARVTKFSHVYELLSIFNE